MIVADSSYLVDGLLQGDMFFQPDVAVVPDTAVAEVLNALYVQEHVLHLIRDGRRYADSLFDFIEAGKVRVLPTSRDLALDSLRIAERNHGSPRDCLSVALALKSDLGLGTRDRRQAEIMQRESARRSRSSAVGRP